MRKGFVNAFDSRHSFDCRQSVGARIGCIRRLKHLIEIVKHYALAGILLRSDMISGYGEILTERAESRLCDKGIFHVKRSANTTAVAGIELDEIKISYSSVLYLIENVDQ